MAIDLTGQRFGMVTVLGRSGSRHGQVIWSCRCDCGKVADLQAGGLRQGKTKSCGCFRASRMGNASRTHGESSRNATAEYRIWAAMLNRCRNPTNVAFAQYGGRGIGVCDRWSEYEAFLADMGRRPSAAHSLEREDNDGNYEPGNVRWATRVDQANNRRSNVMVEYGGEVMPLKSAALAAGLPYKTVHARIARGWTVEAALSVPVG